MTETMQNAKKELPNCFERLGFEKAELLYRDLLFKVMFCIDQQQVDGGVTFANDELNGTVPMGEIISSYQEWKEHFLSKGSGNNASGMVQTERMGKDSNQRDKGVSGVGCVR